MKKVSLLIAIFAFFFFTGNVRAKVLPQALKSGPGQTFTKSAGIGVSPRLRSDKRALEVYFSSLQNASSVSYLLTYATSAQDEGAMGTLNLNKGSSQSTELLFGTCSKNVCRYHTGISNMRLEVTYTSLSGKKYLKKYRVKI